MRATATVLGIVGAAGVSHAQIEFNTGPFTLELGQTLTVTVEKDAEGQIVEGFEIWADYVGDGGSTWASDTAATITVPDGQTVEIGGFENDSDLDYDYQGSGSADPGVYHSGPHFGWIDGGDAAGEYTLVLQQTFSDGIFNDFTVGIGRVPAGCPADCNADQELTVLDFICFQGEWQDQTALGDCNGDDVYDVLDFICYQDLFQQGCP